MKKKIMQIEKLIGKIAMATVALAVTFNVFLANASSGTQDDEYYWYEVDSNGDALQFLGLLTREEAKTATGCNDATLIHCAEGFEVDPEYGEGDPVPSGQETITRS